MWIDDIGKKIEKILNHPDYIGDFGGGCGDEKVVFDKMPDLLIYFPEEYREFSARFGCGELESFFFFEPEPIPIKDIYGRDDGDLFGMYVFATDQSEYVYAFDSKNNFSVVDIDASGEICNVYGSFPSFIDGMLNEILE